MCEKFFETKNMLDGFIVTLDDTLDDSQITVDDLLRELITKVNK